jgi:hypothetical protein
MRLAARCRILPSHTIHTMAISFDLRAGQLEGNRWWTADAPATGTASGATPEWLARPDLGIPRGFGRGPEAETLGLLARCRRCVSAASTAGGHGSRVGQRNAGIVGLSGRRASERMKKRSSEQNCRGLKTAAGGRRSESGGMDDAPAAASDGMYFAREDAPALRADEPMVNLAPAANYLALQSEPYADAHRFASGVVAAASGGPVGSRDHGRLDAAG